MLEEKIRAFGNKISDIMTGKNLTHEEAKEMFSQVLLNEQPDLQQGAFLAAITIKGPTPEEIAGSWEAIYELDTVKVRLMVSQPLVENCGTGMDTIKTFNISTAASVIAAADGIYMAKHGARAITSKCGAVDILEEIGVDVECDIKVVKRSIERAGIGIFNGMSSKVHPQALARILSQIRFGTILNLAGSLSNPALPQYGLRGVYSKELVLPMAQTMREIGYKRAMVVHGLNKDGTRGMDEVSSIGKTIVAELYENGKIDNYTIAPEDFEINSVKEDALLSSSNKREEALSFLRVLGGKEKGPKQDIVCLNAAPILYLMGRARDIRDGLEKAKKIIEDGKAIVKLKEWIREQNSNLDMGEKKLKSLLEQADV